MTAAIDELQKRFKETYGDDKASLLLEQLLGVATSEQSATDAGRVSKADAPVDVPDPVVVATPTPVSAASVVVTTTDDTNDTGFTDAELEKIGKFIAKHTPVQKAEAPSVDLKPISDQLSEIKKALTDLAGEQPRQAAHRATNGTQVVGKSDNPDLGGDLNQTEIGRAVQSILNMANSQQGG